MIKSVFSVVICAFLVLSLCACNGKKEFLIGEFTKEVSFTADDVKVKGQLDFKSKDSISFTIAEPEYLRGVIFTQETVTADDVTINYAKLKDESPVYILMSTLKAMTEGQIYIPTEGEFTLTGATSSAEYKIIFDCETEEIKRIQAGKFTYIFE